MADKDKNKDIFDMVIAEWERERPDLDVSPLGIIGRVRLAGQLIEKFYEISVAPYGIRPADFFILSELRRAGKPFSLTPGDLSNLLVRSTGGITRQLDQLEGVGLIERERDDEDRRSIKVKLTREGLKLIDRALTGHFEFEQQLIEKLAPKSLPGARDFLKSLISGLREEIQARPSTLRSGISL